MTDGVPFRELLRLRDVADAAHRVLLDRVFVSGTSEIFDRSLDKLEKALYFIPDPLRGRGRYF